MATPKEHRVEIEGGGFLIRAANGATLRGAVVRPAGAAVSLGEHTHTQEINYRGGHSHRRFDTTLIQVPGSDRDQDFLVAMTLQRGDAPPVRSNDQGRTATIGKRKLGFDGRTIALE